MIEVTPTAQQHVQDILRPHVLSLIMAGLPAGIVQQAHPQTARVSQESICQIATLPWPAWSPDLSPIKHLWDQLGSQLHQPTSVQDLQAQL